MQFNYFGLIITAFLSSSCTTLPTPDHDDNVDNPSSVAVVRTIKCQLGNAFQEAKSHSKIFGYDWLQNWQAAFSLTFKESNTNSQTGSLNAGIPFHFGGDAPLGTTVSTVQKGVRTGTSEFIINLGDLSADAGRSACEQENRISPPLEGDLLFREEFQRLNKLAEAVMLKKNSEGNRKIPIRSHSYTLEFEITRSHGVNPKFALVPIGTTTIGGGVNLHWKRIAYYKMIVSLAPKSESRPLWVTYKKPGGARPESQLPGAKIDSSVDAGQNATDALTREILRGINSN